MTTGKKVALKIPLRYLLISLSFLFLLFSPKAKAQQKTIAWGTEVLSDGKELANKAEDWIGKIDKAVDSVQDNNFYKTVVDGASAKFPMGILPDNGDKQYALVINHVKMDPAAGMIAQIFMKIPL